MTPSFSRTLHVIATPASANAWVMGLLLLPTLGCLLGPVLGVAWDLRAGWVVALSLAGAASGFALAWGLPTGSVLRREGRAFDAQAKVELDARGLWIEGLGLSPWREVIAAEADHREGTSVTVQTARFGRLALQVSPSTLWPVLAFHMRLGEATGATGDRPVRFAARVFSWPVYRAWILAGYAAAIAMAWLLFAHGDKGLLITLATAAVIVPLAACSVWALPDFRLEHFGLSHRHVFELDGPILTRSDGRWRADMRETEARARIETGPTYELAFLELIPRRGRRVYLLLADAGALEAAMRGLEAVPHRGAEGA